eukprot:jgi/Hompol1/1816/HPOL_005732-RA
MDMNILHEMAFWATGEIETISQKRELDFRESMLKAHIKIAKMVEASRNIERLIATGTVEKALGVIREALRASCILLLRFSSEGSGLKSVLHAYSVGSNTTSSLKIGDEIFHDLALMTLKKEPLNTALHLDSLTSGPVTKDVDHYLNKSIVRCASELIWSNQRPTGVLAAFFEGTYRYLTSQELLFVSTGASVFSALLEKVDLADAFVQTQAFLKPLASALKKSPVQFGSSQGLAPVVMILEPIFPPVKGYTAAVEDGYDAQSGSVGASAGVGGSAGTSSGTVIMANYGPDTGTPEMVASFSHELFFTLDVYNRKARRNIKAHVGIHCDYVPAELASETHTLKDMWTSIVHFAYRLENLTDSTLVSDIFYHQTKEKCTYEQASQVLIRGQGSFTAYRLIAR